MKLKYFTHAIIVLVLTAPKLLTAESVTLSNIRSQNLGDRSHAARELNEKPLEEPKTGIPQILEAACQEQEVGVKSSLFQAAYLQAIEMPVARQMPESQRDELKIVAAQWLTEHESSILESLRSKNNSVVSNTLRLYLGTGAKFRENVRTQLLTSLKPDDRVVTPMAIAVLGLEIPAPEPVRVAVRKIAASKPALDVLNESLKFLAKQKDVSEDSIGIVRSALSSEDPQTQQAALRGLVEYGPTVETQFFEQITQLISQPPASWTGNVGSPGSSNLWNAYMAAAEMAVENRRKLIDLLISKIGSDSEKQNECAIQALIRIRPPSLEAIDRLTQIADDPTIPDKSKSLAKIAIKKISLPPRP